MCPTSPADKRISHIFHWLAVHQLLNGMPSVQLMNSSLSVSIDVFGIAAGPNCKPTARHTSGELTLPMYPPQRFSTRERPPDFGIFLEDFSLLTEHWYPMLSVDIAIRGPRVLSVKTYMFFAGTAVLSFVWRASSGKISSSIYGTHAQD